MKIRSLYFPILFYSLIFCSNAFPQPAERMSSSDIQLALNKLSVLGSALYIAAHPDDENTALLAYLSSEKKVRSGYLSITRGDGGQNLIGSEKGELMGLLRTNELLSARQIDGAEQFFTRAIDFGYSKSADESLEIWGHQEILADIVWVIRKFKPDILITRFSKTLGGHGHHLASAILAEEAFYAAGDPEQFPDQLTYVKPWQPKRLFWNAWRPSSAEAANLLKLDLGTYNPLLGESYNEISARSRSMHKSQGFGSRPRRGSSINYFKLTTGTPARNDIFDGVDLTWNRVPNGAAVAALLSQAQKEFQPENPAASLPILSRILKRINQLPDSYYVNVKREEILKVIKASAGLSLEVSADDYSASPGDRVNLTMTAVNRSDQPLWLDSITLPFRDDSTLSKRLRNNQPFSLRATVHLPSDINYSNPFWLEQPPQKGRYQVQDQTLIGRPANDTALTVTVTLSLNGEKLPFKVPVKYRWVSRVDGQLWRPFEIAPKVTVNFENDVLLFQKAKDRKIQLKLKSYSPGANGIVRLKCPSGWSVKPDRISFSMKHKYDETTAIFTLFPSEKSEVASLRAEVEIGGHLISRSVKQINYDHIPIQTLFPVAQVKLVNLNIRTAGKRLAYIMGSGDDIPPLLREIGYDVTLLSDLEIEQSDLTGYDAIITGVRAFNTRPKLAQLKQKLMDYVFQGGTIVAQYNVTQGLIMQNLGPYPFRISRDRVTVEEAAVTFLKPDHPLLNFPNKIDQNDFKGWVQERGLYFPNEWDSHYDAILTCHDPGESDKAGGLLFTRYGKGVFIYTGYSWFRQLPAGVPGAFRLFANLIAAGKND